MHSKAACERFPIPATLVRLDSSNLPTCSRRVVTFASPAVPKCWHHRAEGLLNSNTYLKGHVMD